MKQKAIGYLIVNFGGPRSLREVEPFLCALLTDQDVVQTGMPQFFHNFFFQRIAKKRAEKVAHQYVEIGGRSPIFEDTEAVAKHLSGLLSRPVLTFHRYLPSTHAQALRAVQELPVDEIHVFPMFPQFTYATTGSIARLFCKHLPPETLNKLRWVKSYPSHPAFVSLIQNSIHTFLERSGLREEETILLFSAHGVPKKFIENGDLYEAECETSFKRVMEGFPKALGRLSYQSQFGPGEWLRPYTVDVCEGILGWNEGREHLIFVPISFTSDHIETLFEIEKEYVPIIENQGLKGYRLPAFNQNGEWIRAIAQILSEFTPLHTSMLVRPQK